MPVKDPIKAGMQQFVATNPLVAPAMKMGQMGQQIMNTDLYAVLQHYINRLSTMRQQYLPAMMPKAVKK